MIEYVYREQNEVADALAKMAANMEEYEVELVESPQAIRKLLHKNRYRVPRVR